MDAARPAPQTTAKPLVGRDDGKSSINLTTTNAGALTKAFHPPADCSLLKLTAADSSDFNGIYGGKCNSGREEFAIPSSCYPSSYASLYSSWFEPSGYEQPTVIPVFSPGLRCPVGYSTATSISYDDRFNAQSYDINPDSLLRPSETLVACCPSGYTAWGPINDCRAAPALSTPLTVLTFNDSDCSSRTITTVLTSVDTLISEVMLTAYPIFLVATNYPNLSHPPHSGMKTGVKVAIGVAIPLVVIFAAIIGFFVFRRKGKTKSSSSEYASSSTEPKGPELGGVAVSELQVEEKAIANNVERNYDSPQQKNELDGKPQKNELDGKSISPESTLHGNFGNDQALSPRRELYGSSLLPVELSATHTGSTNYTLNNTTWSELETNENGRYPTLPETTELDNTAPSATPMGYTSGPETWPASHDSRVELDSSPGASTAYRSNNLFSSATSPQEIGVPPSGSQEGNQAHHRTMLSELTAQQSRLEEELARQKELIKRFQNDHTDDK